MYHSFDECGYKTFYTKYILSAQKKSEINK